MAPEVKLTRGNTSITLTSAPYGVGTDFAPPGINPTYQIGSGTSANRTGGGKLISDRYNNREFAFTMRILAGSRMAADISARGLATYIKANTGDPLYLEYRDDATIPVPLWGQLGAPLRYEIVTADVGQIDGYSATNGLGWWVTLTLEVKPAAIGARQKLANASGGVFEYAYGTTDGTPRGMGVFNTTTNKMTNPVFGHATYDNGWTTGSSLVKFKNTEPRFCLNGVTQSVRITSRAATNNTFVQSIAAGNTNLHTLTAYIMLPDMGTPTSSDVALFYNVELSTTFINAGNGLWIMRARPLGIAAATNTGIIVKNGRSVILQAMQLEERPLMTSLVYGDLVGCAWTGTAHASTSTRYDAYVTLERDEKTISIAEGAVSMVWMPTDSTLTTDYELFGLYDSAAVPLASGLHAWIEGTDGFVYFSDGTNTIHSANAQSWSGFNARYYTFTWGPGGLNIYIAGALDGTGATYSPAVSASQLQFAIGQAGGVASDAIIVGFDVYGEELSAASVSAIYAAQLSTVTAGRRVSYVPYLITMDGTGVLLNAGGTNLQNWGIVAGIAGSLPAQYTLYYNSSTAAKTAHWLGGYAIPSGPFDKPIAQWIGEQSGTADAGSSGGEYNTDASSPFDYALTMSRNTAYAYSFFIRMAGSGAGTVTVTPYLQSGSGLITGTAKACTVSTTMTMYYIGTMWLDNVRGFDNDLFRAKDNVSAIFHGEFSAISSRVDFVMVIPNKVVKIDQSVVNANTDYISYNGKKAYLFTSAGVLQADIPTLGDELELLPDKLNFLWSIIGDHGEAWVIADFITITGYITPKYSLL